MARALGGGILTLVAGLIMLAVTLLVLAGVTAAGDAAYDRGWWVIGAPLRILALAMLLGIALMLVMAGGVIVVTVFRFIRRVVS